MMWFRPEPYELPLQWFSVQQCSALELILEVMVNSAQP